MLGLPLLLQNLQKKLVESIHTDGAAFIKIK